MNDDAGLIFWNFEVQITQNSFGNVGGKGAYVIAQFTHGCRTGGGVGAEGPGPERNCCNGYRSRTRCVTGLRTCMSKCPVPKCTSSNRASAEEDHGAEVSTEHSHESNTLHGAA